MRLGDFFRLQNENRFRVSPMRFAMFGMITGCASMVSVLSMAQKIFRGRRIDETVIDQPPLFVLGHWRTGTTLLHELLGKDERFSFPTTYDCFCPSHFLISRPLLRWLVSVTLPRRRPMDNMSNGVDFPQEDEFALCALGAPTPYRRIAFPNNGPVHQNLLSMKQVDPDVLEKFRSSLEYFCKALTYRDGKRLLLKSPTHTGRIDFLNELFPRSQFVHLSRHPYSIIPSTIHLWKSLDKYQAFQIPKYTDEQLLEFILDSFELMYESYFEQRKNVDQSNLLEIRFEDMVKDPVECLHQVYTSLGLPNFDEAKPAFLASVEQRKSHQINKKKFDNRIKSAIDSRLKRYMQEFGYEAEELQSKKINSDVA